MTSAWSRASSRLSGALPPTRASLRQARDTRLATLRQFITDQDWVVYGLFEDLTQRYPVSPLLGARSAQAELAGTGTWCGHSAVVASVLVQPAGPATRRTRDALVQLTLLDVGPDPRSFRVEWEPQLAVAPEAGAPDPTGLAPGLADSLRDSARRTWLRSGDQVALAQVSLVHARPLLPGAPVLDVGGPLCVLAALAERLA